MTKLNIAQRLNAAMADVDYVQKEKKQGMNYSIVSHDAVTAKVRPILQKHGVVYYPRDMNVHQEGNRTQACFTVRFENIDDRADFIDVATFGYGVDPQDKGPGKAMSYGVKYALLKVLGLETGDDPDEVQDARANFSPANDTKPKKLEGPYTSATALKKAVHEADRNIRGCGDSAELEAYLTTPEFTALSTQLKRDAVHYLKGGPELPDEFEPLYELVKRMKRDFENLENQGDNDVRHAMEGR
jgi:hypothetical protein